MLLLRRCALATAKRPPPPRALSAHGIARRACASSSLLGRGEGTRAPSSSSSSFHPQPPHDADPPPQATTRRPLSMSALQQHDPPDLYAPPPPLPPTLASPSPSPSPPPAASPGSGKLMPFLLADIGEGIAEVELMQWFVREGDPVKQFDRICEVQSDKATVEISSRYDGVVRRVHHAVGAIVKVGSALVDIEVAGDDQAAPPVLSNAATAPHLSVPTASATAAPTTTPAAAAAAPAPPMHLNGSSSPVAPAPPQAFRAADEVVPTTPAVRRLAKEYGVDLSLVRPSGPQGRVLKGDILDYIRMRGGGAPAALPMPPLPSAPAGALSLAAVPPTASPATAAPAPALQAALPPSPLSAAVLTRDTRVPVRGVMRQMVKSMTASLSIPHFGYQDEVVMDRAAALRESLKPMAEAQGLRFSYLPIMIKAASLALLRYPVLNASLSEDGAEVVYHADHNIGVAMDTPKGLVVPVLKRVQDKSLFQIARELTELQTLAATGAFTEEHFTGATFSLSNIGSIGGTYMDAKIVPPQVAIGAIGKIQTLPRFSPDGASVVPTRVMAISWAGDHRVIDGATMAHFSNLWKAYLEEPAAMLAETK